MFWVHVAGLGWRPPAPQRSNGINVYTPPPIDNPPISDS